MSDKIKTNFFGQKYTKIDMRLVMGFTSMKACSMPPTYKVNSLCTL